MSALIVQRAGPAVTVQDAGWDGTLANGLSRGGAADTRALSEVWALLGESGTAVLEMAGIGGRFTCDAPMRIALAGAKMQASLDGAPIEWNAVHAMEAGQVLDIGAAVNGVYGYLGVGGGFDFPKFMGSASTHRASGLGHVVTANDRLLIGIDRKAERVGLALPALSPSTAAIRIVETAHTALFGQEVLERFQGAEFTRSAQGNRQGVALECETSFALKGGQSIPSETVIAGDIQVPAKGAPFALLADCQTTGGYPRIAAILPCDLPRVVQAIAGSKLRFRLVSREEGIAAELAERKARAALGKACRSLLRDPADIHDLLSYQLISGAIAGDLE
ncbi:biotin-dependent carboxyltransferase family protein [Planktotalea sp.]|uniref:5-oxoprolinase subunit C family protein n=1 Tax=Planktotalea sp. TaxID=2029877 RepID=UPI003D6B4EC2